MVIELQNNTNAVCKVKKYDKAIRDKVPEVIESKGKKAVFQAVEAKVFEGYLNNKLKEELEEYYESESIEELADVMEVIFAILDLKGFSREEFEKIRNQKVDERGAFEKRLVLMEVIDYGV